MVNAYLLRILKVGDGPPDLQDLVVGPGAEPEPADGVFQELY